MVLDRLEEIENIIAHQEIDVRDDHGNLLNPEQARQMYEVQWLLAVGMTRDEYKRELGKRYGLDEYCPDDEEILKKFGIEKESDQEPIRLKTLCNEMTYPKYTINTIDRYSPK